MGPEPTEREKRFAETIRGVPTKDNLGIRELQQWSYDKSKLLVTGMVDPPRAGVMLFGVRAEFTLYHPKIPSLNDRFEQVLHIWEEVVWTTFVFPAEDQSELEKIAASCYLRLANGIPQLFSPDPMLKIFVNTRHVAGAPRLFPVRGPRLYTLEYMKDNSKGEKLSPADEKEAMNSVFRQNGVPEV